jgi:superfamily I DNA and RNA helicase
MKTRRKIQGAKMTNKQLKKICEDVYKKYGIDFNQWDLLSHWSGKETDITVIRLASDLAFDSLQCNELSYARAFRDIIHAISENSLNNDGAYSVNGIYF